MTIVQMIKSHIDVEEPATTLFPVLLGQQGHRRGEEGRGEGQHTHSKSHSSLFPEHRGHRRG